MKPISPMLAVRGDPFTAKGWIFEPKIDGTRCIAHLFDKIELQNRRIVKINYRYPELVEALRDSINLLSDGIVLDGEIAVFSKGVPNFTALAERDHQTHAIRIDYLSRALPANYLVFDILYAQGENVMDTPLLERKRLLQEVLVEGELITIMDYVPQIGKSYYQAALSMGIEGIVAKKDNSTYQPGIRSPNWIKIKKNLTADLVVGGYIPGKGHRKQYFGSLLVGAYDSKDLIYLGRVGSGFSEMELGEIKKQLVSCELPPFSEYPEFPEVTWVKPELVVEVSALEVSFHGHLRAPVFHRIREDKRPIECGIEQIRGVKKRV
ncbi:MAG: non-homologous end-joining DNA ligase [Methanotrichaceae archaeon]|nr:non-homologous end-joining DNA ligase [Methanotrichaceae archaeon]